MRFSKLLAVTFAVVWLNSGAHAQLAVPNEVVILRGKVSESVKGSELSSLGAFEVARKGSEVAKIRFNSSGSWSAQSLSLSHMQELEAFCKKLVASGVASVCGPNYLRRASASALSNDPDFDALWGISRIQAPEAWTITEGSHSVVVAVIDTGIDLTHPDLDQNIWVNSDEVDGDGIDNDGNGYVDDIYGYNFVSGDNSPMDDNGHGTHCAGTIGARKDNGVQVVGVSPQVSLMAVKVLDGEGSGYTSDIVEGLLYAVTNGAQVVNMSLGSSTFSNVELAAIRRAQIAGTFVAAAAGNEAEDNDTVPSYPANYPLRNVVSVAASTIDDQLADFSNYGWRTVHISAPGNDIYSLAPGGGLEYMSGTSMAAPHVAGVAALMLAANPNLSVLDVRRGLLESAEIVDDLWDWTSTGGLLNAHDAVVSAMNRVPSAKQAPAEVMSLKVTAVKKATYYDVTVTAKGFLPNSVNQGPLTAVTARLSCKEQKGKKKTFTKNVKTKGTKGAGTVRLVTKNRMACTATYSNIQSPTLKTK